MKTHSSTLLPAAAHILQELGENLKLARKRRQLSVIQMAERAGIARSTLWMIEKGNPAVAMSAYLQVLLVLGLEKDLLTVSAADPLGRRLQDAGLLGSKGKSKTKNGNTGKQ